MKVKIGNVSKLYTAIRGYFEIAEFEISRVDCDLYRIEKLAKYTP